MTPTSSRLGRLSASRRVKKRQNDADDRTTEPAMIPAATANVLQDDDGGCLIVADPATRLLQRRLGGIYTQFGAVQKADRRRMTPIITSIPTADDSMNVEYLCPNH